MQFRGVLTVRYLDKEKNVQTLVFESEWFDFSFSIWGWKEDKLKILRENGLVILDQDSVQHQRGSHRV